jgi:inorganic pyrophosphatase
MPDLTRLELFDGENVRCVIESPRGSPAKFKYNPMQQVFELSRALLKGLTYPFDWGFLPSTHGADGDPIDVLVMHDIPTYPGLVITARLIGVLEVEQREGRSKEKRRNDRFFAVPRMAGREDGLKSVKDLSAETRRELEQFFASVAQTGGKHVDFKGWRGPGHALALLQDALARRERRAA